MVTALIGTAFICGGIQGYQAGVGDLRRAGAFEWPLRVLLIVGGLVLATPGGGILPTQQYDDGTAGARHSRSHGHRRAAARAPRPRPPDVWTPPQAPAMIVGKASGGNTVAEVRE